MRYKVLAGLVCGIGLAGCAVQPDGKLTLQQQVYRGYEKNLSANYAYQGGSRISLDKATEPKTSKNQPLFQEFLQNQKELTADERQQLAQAFAGTAKRSSFVGDYLSTLVSGFYVDYQGVQDLSRGIITLTPTFGSGYTANLQSFFRLPMAVDLKNTRAYIDTSLVDVLLSDKKSDLNAPAQYVYYDFGNLLKNSRIPPKQLKQLLHDMMLMEVALAQEQDFVEKPLTEQDKKFGAVKRIEWKNRNLSGRLAQFDVYLTVNRTYFAKLADAFAQAWEQEEFLPATERDKLNRQVEAAENRLLRALEEGVKNGETDDKTDGGAENPNVFSSYDKGAYTDLDGIKAMIAAQPQAFAQLAEYRSGNSNSLLQLAREILDTAQFDAVFLLDKQGRIVRVEKKISFDIKKLDKVLSDGDKETDSDGTDNASGSGGLMDFDRITVDSYVNMNRYGTAKADLSAFADAVPAQDFIRQMMEKWDSGSDDSARVLGKPNIHTLVENLLARGMSEKEAFVLAYQYRYLKKHAADTDINLPLLGKVAAHLYQVQSDGDYGGKTAADVARRLKTREAARYTDARVATEVYQNILDEQEDMERQKRIRDFIAQHQGLSDAAFFAAYYQKYDATDHADNSGYAEFVSELAQLAVRDMQTQTIDAERLSEQVQHHDAWAQMNEKVYQEAYRALLVRKQSQNGR